MMQTLPRLGPAAPVPPARQTLQTPPEVMQGWLSRVQLMVKPRRFEHVMRVAHLARDIALANGIDPQLAYWSGVLHDVARDLPDSELLRLAPPECDIDAAHPLALHGRAGRTLLEHWGLQGRTERERTVLEAVEDHTTGPRSGNPVSACVYIADVSEPGRGVNADIRELALHDLPAALRQAIVSKVTYLQGRGIEVHPRTLRTFHDLR
ncbi:phosphohydrolase [Deinococcus aquiradiocola]|uniref:bis(5'-nucleosyl)-tetraphosphatase (symmetrical) n=2 Tax=Deinococcus aquiradiocola TaxID=393059 RepID=A0A917UU76_9DEIO|nr:phosphohydrolase [Deinococcus aquiradiocola]